MPETGIDVEIHRESLARLASDHVQRIKIVAILGDQRLPLAFPSQAIEHYIFLGDGNGIEGIIGAGAMMAACYRVQQRDHRRMLLGGGIGLAQFFEGHLADKMGNNIDKIIGDLCRRQIQRLLRLAVQQAERLVGIILVD